MADITGDNSSETIPGTASPDTIQGLGGTDVITGLDGTDTISGGDGADDIDGGDGNDTIYGHSVADLDPNSGVIQATLLADVGSGAVFVTGAPGDDGTSMRSPRTPASSRVSTPRRARRRPSSIFPIRSSWAAASRACSASPSIPTTTRTGGSSST